MQFSRTVAACAAAAMSFCALSSSADVLSLRNGDRITGSVEGLRDGTLRFRSQYGATLKFPVADVAGLWTDGPVTVRYKSGGYRTGRLAVDYAGVIRIDDGRSAPAPVRLDSLARLSQGTETASGFRWNGRVNLGAQQQSGNTDTKGIHADAEITGRSEKDRIRFRGDFNREFDDGSRTEDDFTLFAQHDHFVRKKLYFYTNAKLERDRPQSLTLRTTVGTGAGWQAIDNDRTSLSLEAGPAYSREDLEPGEDTDFISARWAVNLDHALWQDIATFFHNQEGLYDLEESGNVFIDSSTGLRFPLSDGFNLTAQVDLDWDSEPPPEASSLDKKYMLTVGYSW